MTTSFYISELTTVKNYVNIIYFCRYTFKDEQKLTLSLDGTIIESAKNYAKLNNISLSKLIETHLKSITKFKNSKTNITPLVESLSGVITLENEVNYKNTKAEYLIKKHQN